MTFFQVIMLKNLVWHAARFQISCSQCYNSIITFNDGKFMYFEYQNRSFILFFVFHYSYFDIFSSDHAQKSSSACCPISNIVFSIL